MNKRALTCLSLVIVLVLACNFPEFTAAELIATATVSPTIQPGVATIAPAPPLPAPAGAFASPSGDPLNCRSGPDMKWPVVTILSVGKSVEIAGKSPDGGWWYVKHPTLAGSFCWIAASYTTTTGDISKVFIVAAPATVAGPTSGPGSTSGGLVTSVEMWLSKDSIFVAGCMGPIQPITVYAKIGTNGAVTINWHFKDDQSGDLPSHTLKFKRADIQDVSDSFTPLVNAGKHKITLVVDGMNLKGLNTVVTYKVSC